jgi:hypothetical protein
MDPFVEICRLTGRNISPEVIAACVAPKLVRVPAGRVLFAAGPYDKHSMAWGAFEEGDMEWYQWGISSNPPGSVHPNCRRSTRMSSR